jgi:hypothetical protein
MDDGEDEKRKYEKMLEKPKNATEAAVASVLKDADEAKKAKRVRFEEGKTPLYPEANSTAEEDMETGEGKVSEQGPIMEVRHTVRSATFTQKVGGLRLLNWPERKTTYTKRPEICLHYLSGMFLKTCILSP